MFTAEIGAWVESNVAKRDGKGMRKVWVAGAAAAGENTRLSVIDREGDRERHTLTLYVHTPEARKDAREALTLALTALDAIDAAVKAPAPAKAPKAPTPPTRPLSLVPTQNSRKAPTPPPAPTKAALPDPNSDLWFSELMAQANA